MFKKVLETGTQRGYFLFLKRDYKLSVVEARPWPFISPVHDHKLINWERMRCISVGLVHQIHDMKVILSVAHLETNHPRDIFDCCV